MPTVYVLETGARIEVEYQRLLVTLEDQIILRLPLSRVTQVVLLGRVGATTPALHALLERDIPLCFLSSRGQYLGRLVGPAGLNLPLRKAQFARDLQPDFCLTFARALVQGKIGNQYTLAARWLRRRPPGVPNAQGLLADLSAAAGKAETAASLETLLGVEGNAARLYFDLYQSLFDPLWEFNNRNRRPPRDPINALLSFGYTLLHTSLISALEVVGLDPYLGFYHADDYGRPGLALDLEEEFRAPVVDSLVYQLIQWRQIGPDDFDQNRQGVWLKPQALRHFVGQYSRKLLSVVKPRGMDRSISYMKHFEVQARRLGKLILDETDEYQPFKVR